MRDEGVFNLIVYRNRPEGPRVDLALAQYTVDPAGHILLASDCDSVEELESRINALQDELDRIRKRARHIYAAKA
jgi:hypothetical protein